MYRTIEQSENWSIIFFQSVLLFFCTAGAVIYKTHRVDRLIEHIIRFVFTNSSRGAIRNFFLLFCHNVYWFFLLMFRYYRAWLWYLFYFLQIYSPTGLQVRALRLSKRLFNYYALLGLRDWIFMIFYQYIAPTGLLTRALRLSKRLFNYSAPTGLGF